MGAPDLLNALRDASLTVSVDGDRLNVTGPPSALAQFRSTIREQKDALRSRNYCAKTAELEKQHRGACFGGFVKVHIELPAK